MNQGQYSPTIYDLYDENPNWWHENCANQNDLYDRDGYDSYGYDENGFDRVGNNEYFYIEQECWLDADLTDEWVD